MKRKLFNFSLLASAGLLVFGVTSCSSGQFKAPRIKLSAASLEMEVGQTKQIKVSVEKDYQGAPVRWFTTNENVAYFRDDSVGYVTAVGEGEATVTASIAGAFADCRITVTSGSDDPDQPRFTLTSTATVTVGNQVKLSYSVNPVGATLTFSSSDPAVADVDNSGTVTGVSAGSATITGVCSNGITRTCSVTVKEEGGGGGGEDLDIGVTETGLTGSLIVGSPDKSRTTMEALLSKFNQLTNSNVNFSIKSYEGGDGISNFPTGAKSGPDVFPYVSDQTMSLNSAGALAPLNRDDYKNYRNTMLDGAVDAATWNDNVLGYPFAADNGVVMYYDASKVSDPSEIDTIDKLFAKAAATSTKVAFNVTNGFYAASILHTFNQGKSMFTIKPTSTSYTCSSQFETANGLKGMQLAYKIMTESRWSSSVGSVPSTNGILATIVDTSNVREYKTVMKEKYAVAPVPYVDDSKTERICTYLGYKFYGVNNSITDASKKKLAHTLCKFLVSEYAQNYRFEQEKTQPTVKTLQTLAATEPHIAALNAQKASGSTLLLSVFGDEYFNNTSVCVTRLNNDYIADDIIPTDTNMLALLNDLDNSWQS